MATLVRKMAIWLTALVSEDLYPSSVTEYEKPAPTGESRKITLATYIYIYIIYNILLRGKN